MRILVYGAGVQGCELAHRLLQNKKNVVTLLARGEWKERIRSMLQFRTTTDRVATIDTLAPDDCYDLVFVAMQAGQLPQVLPILKQNKSEYFVFMGNDPDAVGVLRAMLPEHCRAPGAGPAGQRPHQRRHDRRRGNGTAFRCVPPAAAIGV